MDITILPIDYRNMTWKQVFETIQQNIELLYQNILGSYTSVEIEQYDGPASSITIQSIADEDTEWLIFKNNIFMGKKDGGTGYSVEGQVITFDTPLLSEDKVTVMITNGNGIAVLANSYIKAIKDMYDSLSTLDIDITRQTENVRSVIDYLDESAGGILDAKTICAAYKEYIEQLIEGTTPTHGDFADEMVAARRGYELLGARLDQFVGSCINRNTFLHSDKYIDGDWVFVQDAEDIFLYLVKDEYSGSMPYEVMETGQYAVCLFSSDQFSTLIEFEQRLEFLEGQDVVHELQIQQMSGSISDIERVNEEQDSAILQLNNQMSDKMPKPTVPVVEGEYNFVCNVTEGVEPTFSWKVAPVDGNNVEY